MTWAKQSIIVQKTHAKDRDEAKGIAKGFSDRMYTSRETGSSFRFRQAPPSKFVEGSFRTKKVPDKGVSIVYGELKDTVKQSSITAPLDIDVGVYKSFLSNFSLNPDKLIADLKERRPDLVERGFFNKQAAMPGTTDNELNAPFVAPGATIEAASQNQYVAAPRKNPLVPAIDVDTQEGTPAGFRKDAFVRGFEKRAYSDEPAANQFLHPGSPDNPSGGTIEKNVAAKRPRLADVSPDSVPPLAYEPTNLNSFFAGDERKYAMESSFIKGFEKRAYVCAHYNCETVKKAYDYEYEAREGARDAEEWSKKPPASYGKRSLVGAGIGSLAGAGIGALSGGLSGAALGAITGGLSGAGIGVLSAAGHNMSVAEGHRVMAMPEDEKALYLKAQARGDEQEANRAAMYAAAHSARLYAPYYQSHPYYY